MLFLKYFLCIWTYIWKSDIFSKYLIFDEKCFFGHFKSQISKCHTHIVMLKQVLGLKMQLTNFDMSMEKDVYSERPCTLYLDSLESHHICGMWYGLHLLSYKWLWQYGATFICFDVCSGLMRRKNRKKERVKAINYFCHDLFFS